MDPFQNVIYMYQEITKFRIVLQTNKLATIKILRQALQHQVVVKQLYKCEGRGGWALISGEFQEYRYLV